MIRRRGLLRGLLAAPVVIRTPGLLMAIKPLAGLDAGGIPVIVEFDPSVHAFGLPQLRIVGVPTAFDTALAQSFQQSRHIAAARVLAHG